MFTHAGLIARDMGHRYASVKRSRIDSGSFPPSDVFSSSGIVQSPVFHSPITSTIAASLPTQSESTFSSKFKSINVVFVSLLFGISSSISSRSEYNVDYKMLTNPPLFKYLSVEFVIALCFRRLFNFLT